MQAATAPRIEHAGAPGRLRLRIPGLCGDAALAGRLAPLLAALPGVRQAQARALTGSAILHHDPAVSAAALAEGAARALAEARAELAAPPADRPGQPPGTGGPQTARAAAAGEAAAHGAGWHAHSPAEVLAAMQADPDRGLTAAEARARLARHGPNRLPREAPPSPLALLLRQFASLPVMMLGGSAAISLLTGGTADAVATLSVVGLNGVLGFVTEGQAERVIHGLMDTGRHPARVLREGAGTAVPASALVPGDILLLGPGMQVGADARLLAAERLRIDESVLTGESLPVPKDPGAEVSAHAPLADRPTMLHQGTIVAEGHGRAVVTATGARTEAARTQALTLAAGRPQAPVEAELDRLGRQLAVASLAACALFGAIGLARGLPLRLILRDALALAVAAVPEGLPMVATTTLSLGLRRMERRGVLIRQMQVVESLGAVQTLCLDKTGTLTLNRMRAVAAAAGWEETAPDDPRLMPLARVAALNNDAEPGPDGPQGSSQTEQALMALALGLGLDVAALRAAEPRRALRERGPGRPWMAVAHAGGRLTVKGAPEAVLAGSARVLGPDGEEPLGPERRAAILALNDRLAARPARVLALAEGRGGEAPEALSDLTFLGLVALADPIRPEAPGLIRQIHRAGIRTVLITGDQAATAAATARALDMGAGRALRIVDTAEPGALAPRLLAGLAREADVFARVASHEKLAIVRALQDGGRVVAMTGDGVNDGPALRAADVGIAMGRTGADLAREVANVVIRDDDLGTLVAAMAQGRAIHRNIRRSLEFLVTTNLSEIAVSLVEVLHGPSELETPMELLWINLVTDVLPGLGLALAAPDADAMARPPRPAGEPILRRGDMRRMGQDGALIAAAALAAHFIGLARHGPGPQTRAMTFLALSQGQLLYTLVCQRSDPRHLHPARLLENRTLDLALLVSSALGALPFFVPGLRRLLGIAPLGAGDAAVSLAAALVPFSAVLARRGVQIALEEVESPR